MADSEIKQPATIEIMGRTCTVGKFGAEEGWKLLHRLTKSLGPALTQFSENNFHGGIKEFTSALSETELLAMLKSLTGVVLVEGRKFSNTELADYGFTLEACAAVIEENFGDFFSQIKKASAAIKGRQTKAGASAPTA